MNCNANQLLCRDNNTSPLYCLDVPNIEAIDCRLFQTACSCPQMRANPDIAGIGVFIAFQTTAILAVCTAALHLLLQPRYKQHRTNPFDEWFTKHVCMPFRRKVPNPKVWSACFYSVTTALSDQQLVTGIAILVAGLNMFRRGTISAYHFGIVRDVACLSSGPHLNSLLSLIASLRMERAQADFKQPRQRVHLPFIMWWRFTCIFVFLGLLMSAIWLTAFQLWDDWAACPAHCVPNSRAEYGGVELKWAIVQTIFLVMAHSLFALQLGEMIRGRADNLRNAIRKNNGKRQGRLKGELLVVKGPKFVRFLKHYCAKNLLVAHQILWGCLKWLRYYYVSNCMPLVEQLVWIALNVYFVSQNRADGKDVFGFSDTGTQERAKEDEWGFGQIVPVLLLMLPAMTFIGVYYEAMKEEKKNREAAVMMEEKEEEEEEEEEEEVDG